VDDETRDNMLVEMHTDIKWIKDQNKYKFMVWAALIGAIISLIAK